MVATEQSIPIEHSLEHQQEEEGWRRVLVLVRRRKWIAIAALVGLLGLLLLVGQARGGNGAIVPSSIQGEEEDGGSGVLGDLDLARHQHQQQPPEDEYAGSSSSIFDDDDEEEEDADAEDAETTPTTPDLAAAMRSMPELEYNEVSPHHKYMIYNPSGGMSNQIMELENAITLARLINRTLYVPRIASHSDFVTGYLRQGYGDTFPADRLVDFTLLSKYTRVIPLNLTNRHFISKRFTGKQNLNDVMRIGTEVGSYGAPLPRIKRLPHKLVYFSGNGMWKWWFHYKLKPATQHYVAYSPHLREMSMRIARSELGGHGKFYAIHGRLGDQAERWGGRTSRSFVNDARFRAWNKSRVVYLASDEPKHAFFHQLRVAVRPASRLKTLDDLQGKEITAFKALFPSPHVRGDMLGVIDKLLCVMAEDFLGTGFSTFTWDIARYRLDRKQLFPELFDKKKKQMG